MHLNNLAYHLETEGSGPALLLLHGFTGSVRAWDEVRPALASRASVIAVDLIGHGRTASPPDAARYTLAWSANDLVSLIDGLGLDEVDVLGYSMGGRMALHFAVYHPQRVRTLILESASPGIEDPLERQKRLDADEVLAQGILDRGLEAFVSDWERQPLLALAPHVSAEIRARQHALRLQNNPLGLANSLRGMGAGRQMPLWSRLEHLSLPVHLIVGERDARYREIATRMQSKLPRASLTVVLDAGHTVHVDDPGVFVKAVECALDNKLTQPVWRC